jgi:hypothetical protein
MLNAREPGLALGHGGFRAHCRRRSKHHRLASRVWSSAASCATTSWPETSRSRSGYGSGRGSSRAGRYRVGLGEIEIDAIELLPFAAITGEDVRRAGEPDRETLRQRAAHAGPIDEDTLVYRIEFHPVRR